MPRVGCRLALPAIEDGAVRVTGPAAMSRRIGWYAAVAAGAALLALMLVRQHYDKFVDRSAGSPAAGVQRSK